MTCTPVSKLEHFSAVVHLFLNECFSLWWNYKNPSATACYHHSAKYSKWVLQGQVSTGAKWKPLIIHLHVPIRLWVWTNFEGLIPEVSQFDFINVQWFLHYSVNHIHSNSKNTINSYSQIWVIVQKKQVANYQFNSFTYSSLFQIHINISHEIYLMSQIKSLY